MIHPETLKHNLKLTEREEKIILIKYIIHGVSPFQNAPLEVRVKMLEAAALICGYEYDDAEFQEIGRACLATQEKITFNLGKFVKENQDLIKTVMSSLKDGNEEIIKVIDPFFHDGLKALGLRKK